MKEERKDNYSPENFEKIFAQFDTDQNGYLEKAEMAVLIKKVFKKSLAQVEKDKAKVKAEKVNVTTLLGAYAKNFSKDVNELYDYMDSDKNGTLDLVEGKAFMVELQKIATEDRKNNFKEEDFEKMFEKFDEDKNGFLEKSELAVLIKHVFKTPADVKARQAAQNKASNKKSLKELLGDYASHFNKDLDEMYAAHDDDLNGMLDRAEMKGFLTELV